MQFNPAEDNDLIHRLVSDCGTIEIGLYRVLFGYRVRAGYTNDMFYNIDWCGGGDNGQIELLYSIAKNILEHQGNFKCLQSVSAIKPFFKDQLFVDHINSKVVKPLQIIKLKI